MKQRKIGSILGYIYTALHALISIIYIRILLSGIGDTEYGLYQIVGSITAYFSLMETPMSSSILRFYSKYKENNDTRGMENTLSIGKRIFAVLSICMVIVLIPTLFIFKSVYSTTLSTNEIAEASYMLIIMVANLIVLMNNYTAVAAINAFEEYIFIKTVGIIQLCVQPLAIVLFIKRFPYAITISLIQLVLSIILSIVRVYYAKVKLSVKSYYHGMDKDLVNGIIKLSASILFVSLADQIFWKTDQLILGAIKGTSAVATYSVGASLNQSYLSVGFVLSSVLLPEVTRLSKQQNSNILLSDYFIKIGRYQMMLLGLLLSGVVLFGKEFIQILAGDNRTEAYWVALLLMIPYTIDLAQSCGNLILQVKDKYHYRSFVMLLMALINIALTLILVNRYGIIGASLATTISIVVGSGFLMNIVYSKIAELKIKSYMLMFTKYCVLIACSIGVGYCITLITLNSIYVQFVLHVLLFSFLYLLIVFSFGFTKSEKNAVLKRLHMIK